MKMTLEYLKKHDACQAGIDFAINNKLINFPLEKLDKVKGDFNEFISWLKNEQTIIKEYDKNNNLIYYKNSNGREKNGREKWKEYDENNNLIHCKYSDGSEYWQEYDESNNLIHYKDSNGVEEWKEYDENNNLIHFKNSNGYEEWKKYDKNNNIIHFKRSDGYENNYKVEYYKDGQLKRYDNLIIPWFKK